MFDLQYELLYDRSSLFQLVRDCHKFMYYIEYDVVIINCDSYCNRMNRLPSYINSVLCSIICRWKGTFADDAGQSLARL